MRKANDVQILVDRIHEAMSTPIDVENYPMKVGASMGVALYPDHGQTAESLLAAADEFMYAQKAHRKAQAHNMVAI